MLLRAIPHNIIRLFGGFGLNLARLNYTSVILLYICIFEKSISDSVEYIVLSIFCKLCIKQEVEGRGGSDEN